MSRLISGRLRARTRVVAPRCLPSTAAQRRHASFGPTPSPPRLPKEEQELFEELQKRSTGAFSTPRSDDSSAAQQQQQQQSEQQSSSGGDANIVASSQGEFHPNMRKGAPPEFEGDVNPKTGEVGGPKNEPLRWGSNSDWSFNGRVTDF